MSEVSMKRYNLIVLKNILYFEILNQEWESQYAFELAINGNKIKDWEYSSNTKVSYQLINFGEYTITYRIRNKVGEIEEGGTEPILFEAFQMNIVGCSSFRQYLETKQKNDRYYLGTYRDLASGEISNTGSESLETQITCIDFSNLLSYVEKIDLNQFFLKAEKAIRTIKAADTAKRVLLHKFFYREESTGAEECNRCLGRLYDLIEQSVAGVQLLYINGGITLGIPENKTAYFDELELKVRNAIDQMYSRMLSRFTIEIAVEENYLKYRIRCHHEIPFQYREKMNYKFIVVKDGMVYHRGICQKENSDYIELKESGIYFVQGYVFFLEKHYFKRSVTKEYFTDTFKEEYKQFIESKQFTSSPLKSEIELYKFSYPHKELLLVSYLKESKWKEQKKTLTSHVEEKYGLFYVDNIPQIGGYETLIFDRGMYRRGSDRKISFSGLTIAEGKLINGQSSIDNIKNLDELNNAVGCFSMIDSSSEEISCKADFLGFNRFFYYKTDELVVISNRYHLLLLILQQLQVPLTLDVDKVLATMSCQYQLFFLQNYSTCMDVKPIKQARVDQILVLKESGWMLEKNQMGKMLEGTALITEEEYAERLLKAKHEIMEQIKVVLEDKSQSRVVVDLTGGLDSRMIYSALTNLKFDKSRICINSKKTSAEKDLEIAVRINNIYGYQFRSQGACMRVYSVAQMDEAMRSCYMGTLYSHGLLNGKIDQKEEISLIGACGEDVARPIIARNYYGTVAETETDMEEVINYIEQRIVENVITDYEKAFSKWKSIIKNEFMKYPKLPLINRLDQIYLTFRHGYHHDLAIYNEFIGKAWYPLQSKSLYELNLLTKSRFQGIKLQLDMLYELNPIIASIPFEMLKDNEDRESLYEILRIPEQIARNIRIETNPDRDSWEKASKMYKITREGEEDPNYLRLNEIIYEAVYANFKKLLSFRQGIFNEKIGMALYYYIIQMRGKKGEREKIYNLYNRLASLNDQIFLIDES